jgi:hypothetical protein
VLALERERSPRHRTSERATEELALSRCRQRIREAIVREQSGSFTGTSGFYRDHPVTAQDEPRVRLAWEIQGRHNEDGGHRDDQPGYELR